MTDTRYIIIGRVDCPFCTAAVDYCIAENIEHVFLDYTFSQEILQEYKEFHQHPTVPIILQNNLVTGYTVKVGGYQEFINSFLEN